jgi:Ran GTPase-activating protein (RanGAP) involved in mRNA processing and transport
MKGVKWRGPFSGVEPGQAELAIGRLNAALRCAGLPEEQAPPTAQSQTSVTSGAAAEPNPYFDVETLLASVESGAIAAVKGTWLVGLHKRGGRLSRRQDLPPEAFWSAGELKRVALALGDDFGVLFVALSYRWLTKEHPDPDGFHLGIVAAVAELYLNLRGGKFPLGDDDGPDGFPSQLTLAFRKHGLGLPEFALFWDFASLHQPPRTDAEAKLFPKGLQNSNVWYGHARTVVWMQSQLPEGFAARMRASEPPLAETYEDSGWCYVEAAISAAIKPGFLRLDLAKRTEEAMACAYGPEEPRGLHPVTNNFKLACVCARRRPPPPSPETVRCLLQTEKRFTNSSDVSKVADLYAAFFGRVTNVDALVFKGLEWGDADVVKLCEVLPRFAAVRTLDLSSNKIGPEGASALGEALKVNAVLTFLHLAGNHIGDEGAKAIANALKVNAVLTTLFLNDNNIGAEGAIAIAEALKVNAVLTTLGLYNNNIGPEGAIAIAEALKVNAVMTNLYLGVNKIGDEGAKAIAEALKVNAVLTELNLQSNSIGPGGAIAIAEALKFNAVMTTLHLSQNQIGAEGASALGEALKVNAVVTELRLRSNNIGNNSAKAIAEALKVNAVMTTLDLGVNNIGDEGAKAIAEALKVTAVVTTLSLGYNSIGDEGAKAISEALKVNAVLTSVDLQFNSIRDDGAKAIAEALKVNAVLTELSLLMNNIGPEGAIAIAEALKVNAVLTKLDIQYNKQGKKLCEMR